MAQRLATEYVKTCLMLSEAQLSQLLQLFHNYNLKFKVKVLENGSQEIAVEDLTGTDLVLTFERKQGHYVLEGSCRFTDTTLANAMRTAVSQFKGDAVVNRIYEHHTVEYQYRQGIVTRITERSKRGERLIYAHKDTVGQLTEVFRNRNVEIQIQVAQLEIDDLLDRRNKSRDDTELKRIDGELSRLTRRLFVLEA
ncbi:non-ribosomal peptide synthetase module [Paenibacillus alkalitolerans]|uniref:non-ribosomal peptide synthetase module n=1 Tax=Paenibacillus alkalitolerans TaxID=2799335 RepID=UPI0018F3C034|nr:non-ribosomal peptide synthetase module [Paenibacillus alkalitolerans]